MLRYLNERYSWTQSFNSVHFFINLYKFTADESLRNALPALKWKPVTCDEQSTLCALDPEEINSPAYILLGETNEQQNG